MIEPIFLMEESARFLPANFRTVCKHSDVTARTEAAAFCMVDHHQINGIIARPVGQRCDHRGAHRMRQRMQRLGPVEANPAGPAFNEGEDFICH